MVLLATVFTMINLVRAGDQLPPLQRFVPLDRTSLEKSLSIRRCDRFDHRPCGSFGRVLCAREGEVLAYGYGTPRDVVRAWFTSPEHRRILMGPFRRIGGYVTGSRWGMLWVVKVGREC